MRIDPLPMPADAEILPRARLEWVTQQAEESERGYIKMRNALQQRLVDLYHVKPEELLEHVQGVVSGAVNMREHWVHHLRASATLKQLQAAAETERAR